jgi:hypothetical protein
MRIKFKNCPWLMVQLDNTNLARQWHELVKSNYIANPNLLFRDQQDYNIFKLENLAKEANNRLGWNWQTENLDLYHTTLMHKDIETFLANGFANIPEEYDELLHEIHFCLHSVESGSKRASWLQLEWYNDDGFKISEDEYPAKIKMDFGDIRLQNPYVGHHPLYLYEQNDTHNIMQTCKFHDLARPGINLVIEKKEEKQFNWEQYIQWFLDNGPDFVEKHGIETIKKFTGHPVVGHIVNLDDLEYCLSLPALEFEALDFE